MRLLSVVEREPLEGTALEREATSLRLDAGTLRRVAARLERLAERLEGLRRAEMARTRRNRRGAR